MQGLPFLPGYGVVQPESHHTFVINVIVEALIPPSPTHNHVQSWRVFQLRAGP